jgi:predicted transcriptional regulator
MVNVMSFNMQKIRMDIKKGNYTSLGSGSGRQVYDLDNGYVVKVARNRKGIAQNKVEQYISSRSNTLILAKVMQTSEDFSLLIMEKAQKITNISDVWNYFHVKSNKELLKQKELKELYTKYHLLTPDLCRACSWGRIHNSMVIIDYGFTLAVKRKYYSFF